MDLPMPGISRAARAVSQTNDVKMTIEELESFMDKYGFTEKSLGELVGVTLQAVRLWTRGQREINMTVTKLLRLMDKYPHLMKEIQ